MVNQRLSSQQGLQPLQHGIGIHTGQVLAASIGSSDRQSYAIIGDTVNLASRIQNLNKQFSTDILISRDVAAKLDSTFSLQQMPEATLQGKRDPVTTLAVQGLASDC